MHYMKWIQKRSLTRIGSRKNYYTIQNLRNTLFALIATIFLAVPFESPNARPRSKSIESVLDKLEKKINSQAKSRTSLYNATLKYNEAKEEDADIFTSSEVDPKMSELAKLNEIERQTLKLENQAIKLSDDVAALRQTTSINSEKNQHLQVLLNFGKVTSQLKLKSIEANLNSVELYTFDAATNITTAAAKIPIYEGFLAKGKHKISVKGSFNRLDKRNITVESERYYIFDETVEVIIDESTKAGKISVDFSLNKENRITVSYSKTSSASSSNVSTSKVSSSASAPNHSNDETLQNNVFPQNAEQNNTQRTTKKADKKTEKNMGIL